VVGAAIRDNGLTQTTRFEALEKFNQKTNTRIVIGSELVYAEEQTPLAHVLDSLVTDLLVLCYTERSAEDSDYFNNRILGNEKFTLVSRTDNIYIFSNFRTSKIPIFFVSKCSFFADASAANRVAPI
jgi:hypothetical protein